MSLGLPVHLPRVVVRAFAVVVVTTILLTGYAAGLLVREDPEDGLVHARTRVCTFSEIELRVPASFEWTRADLEEVGFEVPVLEGVTDMLAFRARNLVQLAVLEQVGDESEPALFVAHPELSHQLGVTRAPDGAPAGWPSGQDRRAWELRRNGEVVAQLVERTLVRDEDQVTLVMLASPGVALTHTPRLYSVIFEEAVYAPGSEGNGCARDP